MKVIVVDDYAAMSQAAADVVVSLAKVNPTASIVWPTGDTPVGAAKELVSRKEIGTFDPSWLRFVQLDEYVGLNRDDPRTLYGWMDRVLLKPLKVCDCNIVRFDANAKDLEAACRSYDEAIRLGGGIDLCVLGLGPNGHLGFNEPPAPADAPTRAISLTEETIVSNSKYWGGRDQVPLQAITAGMVQLLASKQIVVLVSGAHKKSILQKVINGPVSAMVPASLLQGRANVTIIADKAAAVDE
jgi:glucosamine-6-phosphate deaminase